MKRIIMSTLTLSLAASAQAGNDSGWPGKGLVIDQALIIDTPLLDLPKIGVKPIDYRRATARLSIKDFDYPVMIDGIQVQNVDGALTDTSIQRQILPVIPMAE